MLRHLGHRTVARLNRLRRSDWKFYVRIAAFVICLVLNIAFFYKGFKLAFDEVSFIWPGTDVKMDHQKEDQLWNASFLGVLGFLYCAGVVFLNEFTKARNSLTKLEIIGSKFGLYISAGLYASLIFASKNGLFFGLGLLVTGAKGIWSDFKKRSSEREAARQWVVSRASELLIEELESVYRLREVDTTPSPALIAGAENPALPDSQAQEVEVAPTYEVTLHKNDTA